MEETQSKSLVLRVGGVLLLIWEVCLGVALQKGMLDWFPVSLVVLGLVVPPFLFVSYALRGLVRENRIVLSLIVFVLIGAASGAIAWLIILKSTPRVPDTSVPTLSGARAVTPVHSPTPEQEEASPATPQKIEQSATASGGSTINQAGRDIVINQGVSDATVREILKEKLVSEHNELSGKYPAGYVVFGIANGAIVQEPRLIDVRIRANWNAFRVTVDESEQKVCLYIAELLYSAPSRGILPFGIRRSTECFPFRENAPVHSAFGNAEIYYEVLDTTKPIFLMGFK